MAKIFLDPGHGGSDPGAAANGLREKDLTLQIAKLVEQKLKNYEGARVKLSRTSDRTLTLKQRTDAANKWGADIFVSVHINAGGGTGYEDFIYNGNVSANTTRYRNALHGEVVKALGKDVRNRGKKRANFHVLRETRMPAVLTESLFIDNKTDAKRLKDVKFINKVAEGHAKGIAKALGLKKKSKAAPVKPAKGTFYRVVTGSFADKKNADARVAELKKAGFDSFIDVYKK